MPDMINGHFTQLTVAGHPQTVLLRFKTSRSSNIQLKSYDCKGLGESNHSVSKSLQVSVERESGKARDLLNLRFTTATRISSF